MQTVAPCGKCTRKPDCPSHSTPSDVIPPRTCHGSPPGPRSLSPRTHRPALQYRRATTSRRASQGTPATAYVTLLEPVGALGQPVGAVMRQLRRVLLVEQAAHHLARQPVAADPAPDVVARRDRGERAGVVVEAGGVGEARRLD